MSLKRTVLTDDALDQLAGITGLGWTAAMIGYLSAVFGLSNELLSQFLADPRLLLYLGGALFATTLFLDWFRDARLDGTE